MATQNAHDIKRSNFHHLMNTIAPGNRKLKAELDVLGALFIVGLALGIVVFATFFLV
jgi:hypothetical protein